MNKILLIDYMSPKGHENFDSIHIKSLLSLGYNLTLIGREGQFDCIPHNERLIIKKLPNWCFHTFTFFKPLFVRIQEILALIYIMCRYNPKQYDYTIFLCYDILSTFFFRTKGKVILINHNNVGQLDNKIKLILTKTYPEYMHISLNEQMQIRLTELLPGHNVEYVPHGLVPPFINVTTSNFINNSTQILFCPVNLNFNRAAISLIFNDDTFLDYLKSKNMVLYVKSFKGLRNDRNELYIIKERVNDDDYKYLITKSLAVILPYTEEFKYRCSGIMFECVANDITVICKRNPSTSIYKDQIDMYEFDNVSQLIDCIENRIHNGKRAYNKELLSPTSYWREILG